MPIVISRETGAVKEAPTYTQEQLDNAWEQVARAWAAANNNNKRNNKARAPKAYLTDQELLDWFNNWAVRLDADPEETTKLIGDLHAFAEMRKAKKKPILTVNAAGRHAKKLLDYSADFPEYRLAAMRYVLSQSVESNWEKLYPITKPDDFNRWLHDNYGVQVGHVEPEVEYFE